MSHPAHLKTKSFFKELFPSSVFAYISQKDTDFKWREGQISLDAAQKGYLEKISDPWKSMINIVQVHGDKIVVANEDYVNGEHAIQEADAIITDQKNVAIAVRTADCIPLFLYDPQNEVIGIVHAGWKGTNRNISGKTVALIKKIWDSDPSKILAAIGPSIRQCCYEVGPEFKTTFPHDIKERNHKLFLDLVGVNKRQLFQEGFELNNIIEEGGCTCCQAQWHSFRRDKEKSGRMISLMMLKD
jgi:YfiH family protein